MVGKSANPKGLTNDCQVKWKNWPDSSIRAFFLPLKWQSNKPQNWANVVETIMIIFAAGVPREAFGRSKTTWTNFRIEGAIWLDCLIF